MSLTNRYEVWWDVNGALAAVTRRVRDSGNDLFRGFDDYGFYNVKIGCNGKNFNV